MLQKWSLHTTHIDAYIGRRPEVTCTHPPHGDAQRKWPHVGGARRGLGVLIPKAQPKAGFGLDLRVLHPTFSGLRTPLLALILVSLPRSPQEGMDTQLREPHLVWAQAQAPGPQVRGWMQQDKLQDKGPRSYMQTHRGVVGQPNLLVCPVPVHASSSARKRPRLGEPMSSVPTAPIPAVTTQCQWPLCCYPTIPGTHGPPHTNQPG